MSLKCTIECCLFLFGVINSLFGAKIGLKWLKPVNCKQLANRPRIDRLLPLFVQPSVRMPTLTKRKRLSASSEDSPNSESGPNRTNKITTVEELERYERPEERVMLRIHKDKILNFSKNGLFRNTVKNPKDFPRIVAEDSPDFKTYFLKQWDSLPLNLQQLIESDADSFERVFHTIKYQDITAEEAFKLVMDGEAIMVGFETVGHIAHLNVPEERTAVKELIGKIILDKYANIRTVINKRSVLSNRFRTMDFEHLCGEPNYVTNLVENGYKFQLDFSNVYWNSRLIQERTRIRDLLRGNDILIDLFGGVGPFAVYAAKKGCPVLANDLNPDCVKYMRINVELNKVADRVATFNLDGREFLSEIVKKNKILSKNTKTYQTLSLGGHSHSKDDSTGNKDDNSKSNNKEEGRVHFMLNLPSMAVEFLDSFVGLGEGLGEDELRPVGVHCYFFSNDSEHLAFAEDRLRRVLGEDLPEFAVVRVRDVAPNKQMYCLEFDFPRRLLLSAPSSG